MEQYITIGLDAKRIVRNGTGLGSFGRTLVNDLSHIDGLNLRLYAVDKGRDALRLQVAESDHVQFCYPGGLYKSSLGKALWRSRGIVGQLAADGVSVFHGLSGELPSGLGKAGVRSVVTIHDLIFMRHPEYYNKVDVKIYTSKFRQAVHEADRIVAISECTKRDICQLGDVSADRVSVIYQSCASRFTGEPSAQKMWQVRFRYDLPDRYVLNVGSIEERKNVLLAVKALLRLPDDVSLVIVGRSTPYEALVRQFVVDHQLGERVLMLHDVPDDDLPALYRMADAFVYPSRYEGFGIPVIEAIRMGLPVVACTGSCLEEAGGPDSLYVAPDDDQAMAVALQRVLFGSQERLLRVERSQAYVRRFDNTGAAQAYTDIYKSLL